MQPWEQTVPHSRVPTRSVTVDAVGAVKRAFLIAALVFASLGAAPATSSTGQAAAAATVRLPALDRAVLDALNSTRASYGLRALTISVDLRGAADAHARAMLEGGFFAHESADGSPFDERVKRYYRPAGYDRWSAGENLIYSTGKLTADEAIAGWLDSPPHRRNMLNPDWREVGIASMRAASAGGVFRGEPTWVIAMDFGARSGNERSSASPARNALQPRKAQEAAAAKAKAAQSARAKLLAIEQAKLRAKAKAQLAQYPHPSDPFTPPRPPRAAASKTLTKPAHLIVRMLPVPAGHDRFVGILDDAAD